MTIIPGKHGSMIILTARSAGKQPSLECCKSSLHFKVEDDLNDVNIYACKRACQCRGGGGGGGMGGLTRFSHTSVPW